MEDFNITGPCTLQRAFRLALKQLAPILDRRTTTTQNTLQQTFFLVGAFLKTRVDYSHGFSSVFHFDTPEITKVVLPKVLQNFKKTPNCTCWPQETNQKGFSFFPQNIQYRTRLKGPPFSFFGIARLFCEKNSQRVPFNCFDDLRQKG